MLLLLLLLLRLLLLLPPQVRVAQYAADAFAQTAVLATMCRPCLWPSPTAHAAAAAVVAAAAAVTGTSRALCSR
jgi:hypothetical protein